MPVGFYTPEVASKIFDSVSNSYDTVNYITTLGFCDRWRGQMLQKIPASGKPLRILDLLSGKGEMWTHIKKRFPLAEITAVDFSGNMSHMARRKNEEKFNNSITVLNGDILYTPLPHNHYDIVLCAFGLKCFDDEQMSALASITAGILKPDGHFVFMETSVPQNMFFRLLYTMHMKYMVPAIGRVLANKKEYRMLWRYTERFQTALSAAAFFKATGLTVQYDSYFLDFVTGFHGTKIQHR